MATPISGRATKIYYVYDRNDLRQYAVFGQLDYGILLPALHAGVRRVAMSMRRESFTENGGAFFELGNVGVNSPYSQVARFYSFTPKFSLTYDRDPQDSNGLCVGRQGLSLWAAPHRRTTISICLQGFAVLGINGAPTDLWPRQTMDL